jgi:hypothetical protein
MLGFAYLGNTCLALNTKIWPKSLSWVWGTTSFAASIVISAVEIDRRPIKFTAL